MVILTDSVARWVTPTIFVPALYVSAIVCLVQVGLALFRRIRFQTHHSKFNQETEEKPVKKAAGEKLDYSVIFPPTQRHTLSEHNPSFSQTVDLSRNSIKLLSLEADYNSAEDSAIVFSGIRVDEIRALGNFPNYARLSGVPLPSPLPAFDIDKLAPRPFRPFRWAYHQTMSMSKMDPNFWIELDRKYRERIIQRHDIYQKYGKSILDALPGSELACKELMEMAIQFICARYPNQFERRGNNLINNVLRTETDLTNTPPLQTLLSNVPEDFAIMLRDNKTGHYVLRAGVICSSIGWTLGEKMGSNLQQIHEPIPDYKEKMEFSMDRFFSKMPTSKPIQRGSWGFSVGQPIHLPPDDTQFSSRSSQDPSLRPEDIHLRVDWQTLRRLPLSGAVVFNFKVLFTPITEFKDEAYIPSLVLQILNQGKPNLLEHKAVKHVEHVLKPTMEAYERLQIENGQIEEQWVPQTLAETPFFPGWQSKWTKN